MSLRGVAEVQECPAGAHSGLIVEKYDPDFGFGGEEDNNGNHGADGLYGSIQGSGAE